MGELLKGTHKKVFWLILIITILILSSLLYRLFTKWQYQHGFQELSLRLVSAEKFTVPGENCYWLTINTPEQVNNIKTSYNITIPSINFEKQMLLFAYGSELDRFTYNTNEQTYSSRGKYIGFPYFKNKEPSDNIYIYITDKVPLMNTDVAGYSPDYK